MLISSGLYFSSSGYIDVNQITSGTLLLGENSFVSVSSIISSGVVAATYFNTYRGYNYVGTGYINTVDRGRININLLNTGELIHINNDPVWHSGYFNTGINHANNLGLLIGYDSVTGNLIIENNDLLTYLDDNTARDNFINSWGITGLYDFPTKILKANKDVYAAFLQGLITSSFTVYSGDMAAGIVSPATLSFEYIKKLKYSLLKYSVITYSESGKIVVNDFNNLELAKYNLEFNTPTFVDYIIDIRPSSINMYDIQFYNSGISNVLVNGFIIYESGNA